MRVIIRLAVTGLGTENAAHLRGQILLTGTGLPGVKTGYSPAVAGDADLGPAYYLMAVAAISLAGLMTMRDRTDEPLS